MAEGAGGGGHFLCCMGDSELQGRDEKKPSCSEGMNSACLEYPAPLLCSDSLMYEALYPNAGIKDQLLQLVDWKCLQIHSDIPRFCYVFVKMFKETTRPSIKFPMCHFQQRAVCFTAFHAELRAVSSQPAGRRHSL